MFGIRHGRSVIGADQNDASVAEVQAAGLELVQEVLRERRIAPFTVDERSDVQDIADRPG